MITSMNSQIRPIPIVDLELARRLERAEGIANAACVESRCKVKPESGAQWTEIAGTLAMFDAPDSPLTQTFGLGTLRDPTPDELTELESFFFSRGAMVDHEVCPLVNQDFLRSLSQRGYQPVEWTDVMIRSLDPSEDFSEYQSPNLSVRLIEPSEQETWARLAARGWSQDPQFADFIFEMSHIVAAREGSLCFIAELNGQPIATGGLFIHERIALLAGASTIPEARRRGAQRALFGSRVQFAAKMGCDLAVVVALPGVSSHKNAQKSGFQTGYTRTKWKLQPKSQF